METYPPGSLGILEAIALGNSAELQAALDAGDDPNRQAHHTTFHYGRPGATE